MTPDRPLTVLIGALGGQGGGVLADWLVEAAREAGYPAQGTSIPGVAQRTGATTYYFELFPQRDPASHPIFSLFPSAGDVDLVAAMEPTEAGRALDQGLVTANTTVISTALRVFSTAEKVIAGDGSIDPMPILQALRGAARRLIRLDAVDTGGAAINAVMLGAIAGSGSLPIEPDCYRDAIRHRGVAVEANLRAFETGYALARQDDTAAVAPPGAIFQPVPDAFRQALDQLPAALRPMVGHGLARLIDYQNTDYAQRYLDRLLPVIALDAEHGGEGNAYRLSQEVARRLAAWMSYEDVIRVAQLKTRAGRLARIRDEVGAIGGEPLRVAEFLKPGPAEIRMILPPRLARLIRDPAPGKPAGRSLRLPTTSAWGYAALRFLAGLRPWRPRSVGFAREQNAIDQWLAAVTTATAHDYGLACQVAELAVWARGYGQVRERGIECLDGLFTGWAENLQARPEATRSAVGEALKAARDNPDAGYRAVIGQNS